MCAKPSITNLQNLFCVGGKKQFWRCEGAIRGCDTISYPGFVRGAICGFVRSAPREFVCGGSCNSMRTRIAACCVLFSMYCCEGKDFRL